MARAVESGVCQSILTKSQSSFVNTESPVPKPFGKKMTGRPQSGRRCDTTHKRQDQRSIELDGYHTGKRLEYLESRNFMSRLKTHIVF